MAETWTGDAEGAERRLTEEYDGLKRAAHRERVILWFEHDPYDQLILARVLKEIAMWDSTLVELVLLDDYPGVGRFMGLGQLPPTALRSLWERRQSVTRGMTELGTLTWTALTADDPPGPDGGHCHGYASHPRYGRGPGTAPRRAPRSP